MLISLRGGIFAPNYAALPCDLLILTKRLWVYLGCRH